MARIAKITMYCYDANDDFDSLKDEVVYRLEEDKYPIDVAAIHSEEKVFEWDDDCILNTGCTVEEIERFFEEKEE